MCAGCSAPPGSCASAIATFVLEPCAISVAVPWIPALDIECRTTLCDAVAAEANRSGPKLTLAAMTAAKPVMIERIDRMRRLLSAGLWVAFVLALSACSSSSVSTPSSSGVHEIVVVDSFNRRIVSFTDMSGTGWTAYGSQGTGVGQFEQPEGMAADSAGRLYIVDFIGGA